MTITNRQTVSQFPETACVKLRLFENKMSETLNFGTLGNMERSVDIKNGAFFAPSCQLRVVATEEREKGKLLGSTNTWTLRTDEEDDVKQNRHSILLFQPSDISPLIWKLELRPEEYPILYIDESIPNPSSWARNDPTFTSCVLPTVIRDIFTNILSDESPDQEWQKDWIDWAQILMPGKEVPLNDEHTQKHAWLTDLLETFCQRHNMLDVLVKGLIREAKN